MIARSFYVVLATAFLSSDAYAVTVRLEPEQFAALHVGDTAVVQVPAAKGYSIGSGGGSLVLTRRTQRRGTTSYFYRAVAAGNHTLIATPRDPGSDGCVSCVTVHYFIRVIE